MLYFLFVAINKRRKENTPFYWSDGGCMSGPEGSNRVISGPLVRQTRGEPKEPRRVGGDCSHFNDRSDGQGDGKGRGSVLRKR
jgi:hypothetical protein